MRGDATRSDTLRSVSAASPFAPLFERSYKWMASIRFAVYESRIANRGLRFANRGLREMGGQFLGDGRWETGDACQERRARQEKSLFVC